MSRLSDPTLFSSCSKLSWSYPRLSVSDSGSEHNGRARHFRVNRCSCHRYQGKRARRLFEALCWRSVVACAFDVSSAHYRRNCARRITSYSPLWKYLRRGISHNQLDHLRLAVPLILGKIPWAPIQVPMLFFGLFGGFLQALVFSMLTSIYIVTFLEHHDERAWCVGTSLNYERLSSFVHTVSQCFNLD